MKDRKGFRIVLTAMLAAMICVSTICIQIASPVGGYINLGDALVLMSGFMLGPVYGGAAAGIGSALADIITGYAYYAPGTLVIKAAIAAVAALLARSLARRAPRMALPLRLALAGIPGEIIMVAGYLFYAWLCLGYGPGAAASVPGSLVQAAAGLVIAALLTPLLSQNREIRRLMEGFDHRD